MVDKVELRIKQDTWGDYIVCIETPKRIVLCAYQSAYDYPYDGFGSAKLEEPFCQHCILRPFRAKILKDEGGSYCAWKGTIPTQE